MGGCKNGKEDNIMEMTIAREEGDVTPETAESCQETVKEITPGYSPRDVQNLDETGPFSKALPEKSLLQKGKCWSGGKNSMLWITAAFFVNAASEEESLC